MDVIEGLVHELEVEKSKTAFVGRSKLFTK